MIRLSQIDENFSIYKENFVVLVGLGLNTNTTMMISLLRSIEVDIKFICDLSLKYLGTEIEGIKVISQKQFVEMNKAVKSKENFNISVLAQLTMDVKNNTDIEKSILESGIDYVISIHEAFHVIRYKNMLNTIDNNLSMIDAHNDANSYRKFIDKNKVNDFILNRNSKNDQVLIISSKEKTGDHTLMDTFKNSNIPHVFTFHRSEILDNKILSNVSNKIKIITGVRDPLSICLSLLYESLWLCDTMSGIISMKNYGCDQNLFENGGDTQILFDRMFNYCDDVENCIGKFMDNLKENVIDLSKYPFDKEKGYSIIKEGNIEVFAYQLEKMNDIAKEMSDWIGETTFDEWIVSNDAESKWISKSYNQAKKEMKISQKLFDVSYNNPWIEHFYSQQDIQKFKDRWSSQIKD